MNKYLYRRIDRIVYIGIALLIVAFIFLQGCASPATQLRRDGFNLTAEGFERIPEGKDFTRVYDLKIKVHVVSDRSQFNYKPYRGAVSGVAGYANTNNEIWLLGKMLPDCQIIVNQTVLGHELNHLLNWKSPEIVNPDTLDKIGY